MFRSIIFMLPLAAALIVTPTFAQSSSSPMTSMTGMANSVRSPADKAMMDGMLKMNRDMSAAPMTGNPDQDFVAMMIPHHQGAVAMAEVELRYGHDPFLRELSRQIIGAQDQEIGEMRKWQQQHLKP